MKKIITIIFISVLMAATGSSAQTVTKGLIGKQDMHLYYSVNSTGTFSRPTSTGYNINLNQIDWIGIDALQVYGGGVNANDDTLSNMIDDIGATHKVEVWLDPRTWTIADDLDLTNYDNIIFVIPWGVDISISSGKTLTFPSPDNLRVGVKQTFKSGDGLIRWGNTRKGKVSPYWFGDIDGTADDVQIQEAADTFAGLWGWLYCPANVYYLTSGIDINDSLKLTGDGPFATVFIQNTAAENVLNITKGAGGSSIKGCDIEGFGFGSDAANTNGIYVKYGGTSIFKNLRCGGVDLTAYKFEGSLFSSMYGCHAESVGFSDGSTLKTTDIGLSLDIDTDSGVPSNMNFFANCNFAGQSSSGIYIINGAGNTFIACATQGADFGGGDLTDYGVRVASAMGNNMFINHYFEGGYYETADIDDQGNRTVWLNALDNDDTDSPLFWAQYNNVRYFTITNDPMFKFEGGRGLDYTVSSVEFGKVHDYQAGFDGIGYITAHNRIGYDGTFIQGYMEMSYGSTVYLNSQSYTDRPKYQRILVTGPDPFTISGYSGSTDLTVPYKGQELVIEVYNNSGGAMGAITWNSSYFHATPAGWSEPANTKRRTIQFVWDGSFISGSGGVLGTLTFSESANPDTITDYYGRFTALGFRAGDTITVTNTLSNDGTYNIVSLTNSVITLTNGDLTADETSAIATPGTITTGLQRWIQVGPPSDDF